MNRTVLIVLGALLAALFLAGCAASGMYTLGSTDCQRLAQPGDSKIQIYCRSPERDTASPISPAMQAEFLTPAADQTSASKTCRRAPRLAVGSIRTFCGDAAEWDEFDTWAVGAGVTCRWTPAPGHNIPPELCLTAAQWDRFGLNRGRGRMFSPGSNWPGRGTPQPTPSGSGFGYATSYGFSSTGVIGQ
jgi:hypothetical protein